MQFAKGRDCQTRSEDTTARSADLLYLQSAPIPHNLAALKANIKTQSMLLLIDARFYSPDPIVQFFVHIVPFSASAEYHTLLFHSIIAARLLSHRLHLP